MTIKVNKLKTMQKALDKQAVHEEGCTCRDYNLATIELVKIGEGEECKTATKAQLFCQNCKKYRYVVTIVRDEAIEVESVED